MPNETLEHDTIEDALVANRDPLEGKALPEEPEPGALQLKRDAMREKMGRGVDEPWLSIDNEAIWTPIK